MADLALPEKKRFPPNVDGVFSWRCRGPTCCRARVLAWKRAAFIALCAFPLTPEGFPNCAARFDVLFPAKTSVWKTRSGADMPACLSSAASFASPSRSLALGPHPRRSEGRTRPPKSRLARGEIPGMFSRLPCSLITAASFLFNKTQFLLSLGEEGRNICRRPGESSRGRFSDFRGSSAWRRRGSRLQTGFLKDLLVS